MRSRSTTGLIGCLVMARATPAASSLKRGTACLVALRNNMPAWNSTTRSTWRPCEAMTKAVGLCANKAHVNINGKLLCRLHAKLLATPKK